MSLSSAAAEETRVAVSGDLLELEETLVHPAAECFRLMHDDELESLAADIAEHGLRDAITLGRVKGEDVGIVDGRNRYRACLIASVEPRFVTIDFRDDDEVRAFVVSRSERRNVTKGEHAMGIALAYPGSQGKKDEAARTSAETADVSMRRVQVARQVLRYSLDKALAVRDGILKLDKALDEVRQALADLESDETKLRQLRSNAADLADLVAEETLSLSEAFVVFQQREAEKAAVETQKRETLLRLTEQAYRGVTAWANADFADAVQSRLDDPGFRKQLVGRLRIGDEAEDIHAGARALKKMLGKIR